MQLDFQNNDYRWEPTDTFTMNGTEFSIVFNNLQAYLAKPEVQEMMAMVGLYKIMEAKLSESVDNGMVKVSPKGKVPNEQVEIAEEIPEHVMD